MFSLTWFVYFWMRKPFNFAHTTLNFSRKFNSENSRIRNVNKLTLFCTHFEIFYFSICRKNLFEATEVSQMTKTLNKFVFTHSPIKNSISPNSLSSTVVSWRSLALRFFRFSLKVFRNYLATFRLQVSNCRMVNLLAIQLKQPKVFSKNDIFSFCNLTISMFFTNWLNFSPSP